jgi:electron transport complex protein RnfE
MMGLGFGSTGAGLIEFCLPRLLGTGAVFANMHLLFGPMAASLATHLIPPRYKAFSLAIPLTRLNLRLSCLAAY